MWSVKLLQQDSHRTPFGPITAITWSYTAGSTKGKLLQNSCQIVKRNIIHKCKKMTNKHCWSNPTCKEGFIHEASISVCARALMPGLNHHQDKHKHFAILTRQDWASQHSDSALSLSFTRKWLLSLISWQKWTKKSGSSLEGLEILKQTEPYTFEDRGIAS